MDDYGPIDAPRIEGFPLLLSTEEARNADPNFEWVVSHISSKGITACMTETCAEYFPNLVPHRFQTSPMWILWLPDEFADEIHVQEGFPEAYGEESRDLMESYTVLDWPMKHKTVRVKEHFLRNSINDAGTWLPDSDHAKPLLIVCATPSRLALYATWIDELTMTGLQCLGISNGENHRPYRRYSQKEIEDAAKEAAARGNTPETDWKGRPLLWLPCYTYSRDR